MKIRRLLAAAPVLLLLLLSGCVSQEQVVTGAGGEAPIYALITKSQGNTYNDLMAEGFQTVIEEAGYSCIIGSPSEATAEAQMEILQDLIIREAASIAVAANDAEALGSLLQQAMEEEIRVSTVDSDVNASDRQVFVNQVSTSDIAGTLLDAVCDITGGSGQWAILSTTGQATNQNAWITAMRAELEKEEYQELRLVDIVYGNDEKEQSKRMTEQLLEEYPDLKVICAPTTVGLEAVAEVLAEHPESGVKVTGLGLPSDMAGYVTGEDPVCPCLFLWNPIDLGRMSAYVSLALVSGEISGKEGESFDAGEMGRFQVEENENGAAEVVVAPPIRFDASNIDEWKDLF